MEQIDICQLLSCALQGKQLMVHAEAEEIVKIADRHKVLALLYELSEGDSLSPYLKSYVQQKSRQTVQQSYRLLFLTKYLVKLFEEQGIHPVVLKGCSAAVLYPVPELRKSGDIDILISKDCDMENIERVLESAQIKKEKEQWSVHHQIFATIEGIKIELHTMPTEPFENEKLNRYIKKVTPGFFQHIEYREIMGVSLPVLEDAYQAYQLLLHMLQHFLTAGFGLRLLCDWVVFWNRPLSKEIQDTFLHLVNESQICGFAEMVTKACILCLGLKEDKVQFMFQNKEPDVVQVKEFMTEIFAAEEFGQSDPTRMVTLQGTKLRDYFHQFHHQMKLTYPKASRCIVLYPALWVMTLCGFLYRNRKVRGTSSRAIMKKAHKRSKFMEQIHLFR